MSGALSFLGGGSKSVQPSYTSLDIQTSAAGLPIPIIYGAQKVAGNLLWYGDFQQANHGGKKGGGGKGGGGKGNNAQTTYSASFIFGLGEGVITPAVANIILTNYGIQSSGVNSQLYQDLVSANGSATVYSTTSNSGGTGTLWVNQGQSTLSASGGALFSGGSGQTPWGYLASAHADQALYYGQTAYMAFSNYNLGGAPQLPNLWLECYGNLNSTCSSGTPDADPAQVVYDFLLRSGFPKSRIDYNSLVLSANSYQKYMGALGIGFSMVLNEQKSAADHLNEWLSATNTAIVESNGLLKFIPYGDLYYSANNFTYTPNTTTAANLTDDDYVVRSSGDYLSISRSDPLDAFNDWKIEILDRQYDYNINIIESKDQANIDFVGNILANGERVASTIQAHFLADSAQAMMCLELIKNRQLYIRNQYSFNISWENCLLEPMDLITLTSSNMGLSSKTVRIQSLEEDSDGSIKVMAEDYYQGAGWSVAYPSQSSSGFVPNTLSAPSNANAPVIFEPPAVLSGAAGAQVWIASSGVAGGDYGGSYVWLSYDGTTYALVGMVQGSVAQGVLSGSISNTDNTLNVNLSMSDGVLNPVPSGGAAQGLSLFYLDGELMAYNTETLTSAYNYQLSSVLRGMYGSTQSAHASGSNFAFLVNNNICKFTLPTNTDLTGSTIYIKLQAYNVYGQSPQDISTCTPYSYTVLGTGNRVNFDITASESGLLTANQQILHYIATYSFFIPAGFTGTMASIGTNPTSSTTFTLAKNGTSIGSISVAPSGALTLTSSTQSNFNSGDVLTMTAPTSPDATLANIAFSIPAVKV